jgi:hypothetical protein
MSGPKRQPGDPLTDQQRRAWETYDVQSVKSIRLVAEAMGIRYNAARDHINAARTKLGLPDGIRDALERTGIDPEHARFGYRRVKGDDGGFNTVMWRIPDAPTESIVDRLHAAFEGIRPAPPIPREAKGSPELLDLIPIADLHLGMRAPGHGTADAVERLRSGAAAIMGTAHTCVILNAGDFFHQNDDSHATPASKHPLDVDGRMFEHIDAGVQVTADVIELALRTHEAVICRSIAGNHDPTAHIALTFAMAERYRDNPRVTVEKSPSDLWAMSWGSTLLGGTTATRWTRRGWSCGSPSTRTGAHAGTGSCSPGTSTTSA